MCHHLRKIGLDPREFLNCVHLIFVPLQMSFLLNYSNFTLPAEREAPQEAIFPMNILLSCAEEKKH